MESIRIQEKLSNLKDTIMYDHNNNTTPVAKKYYKDNIEIVAGGKKKNLSDYEIIPNEKLGEGAFSSVQMCRNRFTKQKFAIKVIKKSKLTKHELELLDQEIQILKKVKKHSNIIALEAIFKTSKYIYMILELCLGGDLFDYISSLVSKDRVTYKFNEKKSANILLQIANAINYSHRKGIIHRDLKPENILFKDKKCSYVKVIDFGLSSVRSPMYTKCGTPNYVAPEILTQDCYGKKVDWWAVGCILHLLLSGRYAFQNENTQELYSQIINNELTFTEPYWKRVSKESKSLIKGLLKKNPRERYGYKQIISHPWMQKHCSHLLQQQM